MSRASGVSSRKNAELERHVLVSRSAFGFLVLFNKLEFILLGQLQHGIDCNKMLLHYNHFV